MNHTNELVFQSMCLNCLPPARAHYVHALLHHWNVTLVHFDEAITFSVFQLSQISLATRFRSSGWNSYHYMFRSFSNLTMPMA